MTTLLISGAPNSGKSMAIFNTAQHLLIKGYKPVCDFHDVKFDPSTIGADIETLFEKEGKYVLLHSATDTCQCIDRLVENIKNCPHPIDVLITTCRRDNPERQYLCDQMHWTNGDILRDSSGCNILQIPLVRIKYDYTNARLAWYHTTIFEIVKQILNHPPYEL